MASPTVTSLTYDRPGTMQISTPGVPGSAGTGPINMNTLFELMRYKAATREWEARRQAALQDREMRMRERLQQAQLAAMNPVKAAVSGHEGDVTGKMQQLALRKAQGEVNDADSIRNLRKVPVNMGIYGTAYDWDTRSMNPIQQRAVSPENAVVANEGMTTGEQEGLIAAQRAAKAGMPQPGSLEDFKLKNLFLRGFNFPLLPQAQE